MNNYLTFTDRSKLEDKALEDIRNIALRMLIRKGDEPIEVNKIEKYNQVMDITDDIFAMGIRRVKEQNIHDYINENYEA